VGVGSGEQLDRLRDDDSTLSLDELRREIEHLAERRLQGKLTDPDRDRYEALCLKETDLLAARGVGRLKPGRCAEACPR